MVNNCITQLIRLALVVLALLHSSCDFIVDLDFYTQVEYMFLKLCSLVGPYLALRSLCEGSLICCFVSLFSALLLRCLGWRCCFLWRFRFGLFSVLSLYGPSRCA